MLAGKRILITGASSGIGEELCRLLAPQNRIFAVARRPERIPDLDGLTRYACDVSSKEGVDRMLDEAFRVMGDVDIFLGNAGFAYCERYDSADWDRLDAIFRTNVYSPLYSLAALRQRKGHGPFHFVVTASAMSFHGLPGYALYSGTKFALRGFADSLRHELTPGQKIQLVYPIATLTSFFEVAKSDRLPWPRQRASTVAAAIERGIRKGSNHIYPSKFYRAMQILNRFIPVIPIYMGIVAARFRREAAQGAAQGAAR